MAGGQHWLWEAGPAILGNVLQPDRGLYLIRMTPSSQRGPWQSSSRVTTAHPNWATERELNEETVYKIDIEAHSCRRQTPPTSTHTHLSAIPYSVPGWESGRIPGGGWGAWRLGCKKSQSWPESKSSLHSRANSANAC